MEPASARVTEPREFGFDTRALHAGQRVDPITGARAVPIYQTTSYVFEDADHAADLFDLNRFGNIYTRIMNPTTAVFEERMASLEGGVGALATASGLAAQSVAITTLLEAGDDIVSSAAPLRRQPQPARHHPRRASASTTTFVDPARPRRLARGDRRPRTRLLYGETIGNPRIDVLDIAAVAEIARRGGRAADDRQHLRHPLPLPADRARRRHRVALGDQVHRRPRHLDRRRDRRRGHLPVGRRPLPGPGRAERGLPRHALLRDLRQLRLHHEGARRDHARPRAGALARSTPSCSCRASRRSSLRMDRHVDNARAVAELPARAPAA